MDLRDKPSKVQLFLEIILRFRLIFLTLLVILTITFLTTHWQAMSSLPLAFSEALGMWLANIDANSIQNAKYLMVSAISMFVLFFVFGGIKSGLASIVSLICFLGSFLLLAGSEGMQFVFYIAFLIISLIFLFFIKINVSCVLFPFALSWLLWTGFISVCPLMAFDSWFIWAIFSSIGFTSIVSFAFIAGKELNSGTPQSGALVKAGKKLILPCSITSLLVLVSITLDMGNATKEKILCDFILWVSFFIWFFGFTFGIMAFSPWDRLRSSNRKVNLKEKKNSKKR